MPTSAGRLAAFGQGSISPDVLRLFVIALPVLLAGTWFGTQALRQAQ